MPTTTPEPGSSLTIATGHTLLLENSQLDRHPCLTVTTGLVRVAISAPAQEPLEALPITLGFLQAGDHLPLDLLRQSRLHLQALLPTQLQGGSAALPAEGCSSLHDWTLGLLLVRRLGEAEQRIQALLTLLVKHLGARSGAWYSLPMHLTHTDLAEMSGHTRVTVTRQLSRWRDQGMIAREARGGRGLRIAPALVESGAAGSALMAGSL